MKRCYQKPIYTLGLLFLIFFTSHIPNAYALDHIEIINIEPTHYYGNRSDDEMGLKRECKKWKLSKQQIKDIFYLSAKTDFIGIDLSDVSIYSCEIKGKLKSKGQILNFAINYGSSSTVFTNHETTYYVCEKKECEKYFAE